MTHVIHALEQVCTLFLIMVLGYVGAKVNIISNDMRKRLCSLMLSITLPLQILSSFQFEYSQEILSGIGAIALVCGVYMLVNFTVAGLMFRKSPEGRRPVLWYAASFGNVGFMGIPIMEGLLGDTGVIYASIVVAVFNFLVWTVGIVIFTGKPKLKELLGNLCLWSVLVGLALFLLKIRLPAVLAKTCSMMGAMTSPVAMLVLGAVLAECRLKELFTDKSLYLVAAMRLLVFPAVIYGLVHLVAFPTDVAMCLVLINGMPPATNTVIMATGYGGDEGLASRVVALGTLIYPVTAALWMTLIL